MSEQAAPGAAVRPSTAVQRRAAHRPDAARSTAPTTSVGDGRATGRSAPPEPAAPTTAPTTAPHTAAPPDATAPDTVPCPTASSAAAGAAASFAVAGAAKPPELASSAAARAAGPSEPASFTPAGAAGPSEPASSAAAGAAGPSEPASSAAAGAAGPSEPASSAAAGAAGPRDAAAHAPARLPHIADRLARAVAERESQVVLGLDPDPARLWPPALERAPAGGSPAQRAAAAVAAHCRAVIDAVAPACVAVKLQLACFERLGAPGWTALGEAVEHARHAGLLVLADGKRGDIAVSAAAYGQALVGRTPTPFGDVPGLGADAFTASPYLGVDTLEVLIEAARAAAAAVFVLVRTSNPGASDLEDLELAGGGPVWARVATIVDRLGAPAPGASGLHDVGAVVGATAPEHIARLRELMPRTVFLLPGIGAQGGRVEDVAPAFAPGPAAGLVTASRSIVAAHETGGGAPAEAARTEAERLRSAAWSLAQR